MDRVEAREQLRALNELIKIYGKTRRFTAADICRIHYVWLGNIYSWAGKYDRLTCPKVISLSRGYANSTIDAGA